MRAPAPSGAARRAGLALALVASSAQATGDVPASHTYANPIDIDYRYNWEQANEGVSYRTGADPAVVRHRGAYYLFATLADGYWRSTDLVHWHFVVPSRWPLTGIVAPAVWSDGARLYLMPSTMEPGPIFVSSDPARGRLDLLTRRTPPLPHAVGPGREDAVGAGQIPPGPWDPALFRDDDARWYLYWGSSNVFPIYGAPLTLAPRVGFGDPRPLIALDPVQHGWERFGRDQSGTDAAGHAVKPFAEGAWMTKAGGRYYLQYAAPGTEFNAYATGTYVGDTPLGPFRYAPYNPVAYKPGGFAQGAGHGSTFADDAGNWWTTGTSWIGVNSPFERRISLFPARFYADGQMAVSTRFGDWPHWMPHGRVDDPERLFAGWMLLSYRARATASSTLAGHSPADATDEDPRSAWVAAHTTPGETLTLDLGGIRTIRAIQVNFADINAGRFADAPDIYSVFQLQGSNDGRHWSALVATGHERRDRPNAYFELPRLTRARYVRYVHGHVGAAHLAIADLRVFGRADGPRPATPSGLTATRGCDSREARIAWSPVPGATGYNVRWGIRPDRLVLTDQLFADRLDPLHPARTLRALDVGQPVWVAVEAFDGAGVSSLSRTIPLPAAAEDCGQAP